MFAIRTAAHIATAALVLAAAGANAATSDPTGPAKAASAKQMIEPSGDTRRYCVVTRTTGSIMAKKECRTRTDWIERTGIDPAIHK